MNWRRAQVLSAFLLAGGLSFAQPPPGWRLGPDPSWPGSGGWGPGGSYGRAYNLVTVETVRGEVKGVDRMTPRKGMSYGIHLMLDMGEGLIPVHLGPGWFIERQDMKLNVGDSVEIRGSLVTFDGAPAIIAAEVRKGSETLILRDGMGFPVWAGWRRR